MVIVKEQIRIEETKNKTFIAHRLIDDEMTPEQVVANYENLKSSIKQLGEELAKVTPEEVEAKAKVQKDIEERELAIAKMNILKIDQHVIRIKKEMNSQLKEFTVRLQGLAPAVTKARVYVAIEKKKQERAGKKGVEKKDAQDGKGGTKQ